ncbi:nephrin [Nephila pilipes]|uniref:Nephrin n=1 Tax=Nephila pilipes TaxID=299642 RepID=A0A8X6QWQ1_NEPPI|nr:nephrin [Nephila pilipes]
MASQISPESYSLLVRELYGVPGIKIKSSSSLEDTIEYPEIHAVIGSTIYLPCSISPPAIDDSIVLVLWYRLDLPNPIYTLDARAGEAKHFSSKVLGQRAYFNVSRGASAHIRLEPVEAEDEGEYRCRIDYKRGRTLNRLTKVNVIVPVKQVLIRSPGDKIYSGFIGPFTEGERLVLICEAVGGRPVPSVVWKKGPTILQGSISRSEQGWIRNEIVFDRLRRQDLFTELLCQASNNNLTASVTSSVTIDLNLKPLGIQITNPPSVLTAKETLELNCQSEGSKPPSQITWTKGMEDVTHLAIHNVYGRISVSSLTFVLMPEDNGKKLTCKAENPHLPESALYDSLILNVQFSPILSLVFGASVQSEHIREGSDVYFECNIQANPPITEFRWRFQSHILEHDPLSGIVIRNHSLLIHSVSQKNRGRYQCIAENSLGRGRSEEVLLRIQHSPVCISHQQHSFGTVWQGRINLTCSVEADPNEVTFTWTLNDSVVADLAGAPTPVGSKSVLEYQTMTRRDYGFIQCHAKNAVGKMGEPCVFNVVPTGPPPPLRNCVVTNQTTTSLSVSCDPDDTSKQPTYHLEMYDMRREELLANITSRHDPSFFVRGLPPGSSFIVALYTTTPKGKSETVALTTSTVLSSERHKDEARGNLLSVVVLVSLAVLGTLAILAIVAGIIVFRSKTEPAAIEVATTETELTEKMPKTAKQSFDDNNPYVYHTTDVPSEFVNLTPKSAPVCLYNSLIDTHQKNFESVLCKAHSLSEEDIEVILPVFDR